MSLLDSIEEHKLKEHGSEYKEFKDNGGTVISPSGARNFLDNKSEWRKNVILGERTFTGNQNTMFGSLVHLYAERYYEGELTKEMKLGKQDLEAFQRMESSYSHEDVYFQSLCQVFRKDYLSLYPTLNDSEGYLQFEVSDDLMVCGTYDGLSIEDGKYVLIDFKTTSRASKDMNDYYLQLSIYALLLEKLKDIKVEKFRIVQIVKTKLPKVNVIEDEVDLTYARKILNSMIFAVKDYPTLTDQQKEAYYGENLFSFTSDLKLGKNPKVIEAAQIKGKSLGASIF